MKNYPELEWGEETIRCAMILLTLLAFEYAAILSFLLLVSVYIGLFIDSGHFFLVASSMVQGPLFRREPTLLYLDLFYISIGLSAMIPYIATKKKFFIILPVVVFYLAILWLYVCF
jgi:hypothetical protein